MTNKLEIGVSESVHFKAFFIRQLSDNYIDINIPLIFKYTIGSMSIHPAFLYGTYLGVKMVKGDIEKCIIHSIESKKDSLIAPSGGHLDKLAEGIELGCGNKFNVKINYSSVEINNIIKS